MKRDWPFIALNIALIAVILAGVFCLGLGMSPYLVANCHH